LNIRQQEIAASVNKAAEKLHSLDIDSVVVASYDVNTENFPPRIENQEVPMIYFLPAYHKDPPYLRFMKMGKVSELIYFAQQHADIPF